MSLSPPLPTATWRGLYDSTSWYLVGSESRKLRSWSQALQTNADTVKSRCLKDRLRLVKDRSSAWGTLTCGGGADSPRERMRGRTVKRIKYPRSARYLYLTFTTDPRLFNPVIGFRFHLPASFVSNQCFSISAFPRDTAIGRRCLLQWIPKIAPASGPKSRVNVGVSTLPAITAEVARRAAMNNSHPVKHAFQRAFRVLLRIDDALER